MAPDNRVVRIDLDGVGSSSAFLSSPNGRYASALIGGQLYGEHHLSSSVILGIDAVIQKLDRHSFVAEVPDQLDDVRGVAAQAIKLLSWIDSSHIHFLLKHI